MGVGEHYTSKGNLRVAELMKVNCKSHVTETGYRIAVERTSSEGDLLL